MMVLVEDTPTPADADKSKVPFLFVNDTAGNLIASRKLNSYTDVIEVLEENPGQRVYARGLSHNQRVVVARHFGFSCHCRQCQGVRW